MKVSVIIPIYNVERYLAECLDSLVNQTLEDIEIICVNDGSTDSSKHIIEEYCQKDSRVILVDKENGGVSSARNAGLQKVTGEYIAFVDSDDYLDDHALEYLYSEASKDDLDQLYYAAEVFYDDCHEHEYSFSYQRKGDYSKVTTGRDLFVKLIANWEFKPVVVLALNKAEFIKKHGLTFLEGFIHEDNSFTIQSMFFAERVRCINEALYKRRVRKDSIMTDGQNFKHAYHYYKNFKTLETFCETHEVDKDEAFYQALMKYIDNMAVSAGNHLLKMEASALEDSLKTIKAAERMEFYARTYVLAKERAAYRKSKAKIEKLTEKLNAQKAENDKQTSDLPKTIKSLFKKNKV